MAILLLEPQDLTPAQAARVLDFLNSAASAAEIAAKVEFPGELDIGVRLGQRLLDARTALGGRYTHLAQVDAVPLIGPERFTEICAAALGLDPRRDAGCASRSLGDPPRASGRADAALLDAARAGSCSSPATTRICAGSSPRCRPSPSACSWT